METQRISRRAATRIARPPRLKGAAALVAALLAHGAASAQQPSTAEKVENTRPALEKWVEARRAVSLEKRDWEIGREMLTERVALVEREIATLRAKIADAEKSVAEAEKKKAELDEKNERLKAAAKTTADRAGALEARTKDLLKRLPRPIAEKVKPLSGRLPEKAEDTKVSLSERLRNVVGILNEVNKWNREVVATSEVRALGDGRSAEVVVLYVGLGRAYYVGAGGKAAGYGKLTPEGWVWTAANDTAAEVAAAVAMHKNERPAAFVRLPIRIE